MQGKVLFWVYKDRRLLISLNFMKVFLALISLVIFLIGATASSVFAASVSACRPDGSVRCPRGTEPYCPNDKLVIKCLTEFKGACCNKDNQCVARECLTPEEKAAKN